jgi:hypothetical protein
MMLHSEQKDGRTKKTKERIAAQQFQKNGNFAKEFSDSKK